MRALHLRVHCSITGAAALAVAFCFSSLALAADFSEADVNKAVKAVAYAIMKSSPTGRSG